MTPIQRHEHMYREDEEVTGRDALFFCAGGGILLLVAYLALAACERCFVW